MSAPKFTPGPWHQADAHGPSPHGFAVGADGDNWLICEMTGYYGREIRIANARLIAAAPELYAALRVILIEAGEGDARGRAIDLMSKRAIDAARAALAKVAP